MSKVLIEESTLTSIANAIREKTATSSPIQVSNMNTMILNIEAGGGTGNAPTAEELTFSGICMGMFKNGVWDWFLDKYANDIRTNNIDDANGMFDSSHIRHIPFGINFNPNRESVDVAYMFNNCSNLEYLPTINNCRPFSTCCTFQNCTGFTEIDISFIDWSYVESHARGEWDCDVSSMFYGCARLRKLPTNITKGSPNCYAGYAPYYQMCCQCYSLDEIVDLPICHEDYPVYENMFENAFWACSRVARVTFKTNSDGTPKTAPWSAQVINLYLTGYDDGGFIPAYSPELEGYMVNDDASYQAMKDSPDWWTNTSSYSRYNKTSAEETIHSLPDTHECVAETGSTNIIQFRPVAGASTDGDAISNLSPEIIQEAADKGWTVSFT